MITLTEVLGFNSDHTDTKKFLKLFNSGLQLDIDQAIVLETIKVRKLIRIKLPDAIIAATAIVNNLELITDNLNDFIKVPLLKAVKPGKIL